MGYRAVALSLVDGAGGESIGHQLARKLGFGYLNEAVVAQVARDHGVDPAIVAGAERRKSFFTRVAEMAARGAVDVAPDPSLCVLDETDTLLALIRDALRDAADRGSVVLVAHAACYACADRPDVLRVGVTAPLPARESRVARHLASPAPKPPSGCAGQTRGGPAISSGSTASARNHRRITTWSLIPSG